MRYLLLFFVFFFTLPHVQGQDLGLAKNYLERGEYEKAEAVFKKLYEGRKSNFNYLDGLVKSLQQQEKFEEAHTYLEEFENRVPNYPAIHVEIGKNYEYLNEHDKALYYYRLAVESAEENPNYALQVGRRFHQYNLLEEAAETYERANAKDPKANNILELARIYGEQRKLEKMFDTFFDLLLENERYHYAVNRYFTDYITDDPTNEANQILRRTLLKRLQQDPQILYNEFLSWLYIQENEFKKAFVQEKAIFQRSEDRNLLGLFELAQIAVEKDAYGAAIDVLDYAVENSVTQDLKIRSYSQLMKVKISATAPEGYPKLDKEFQQIFEDFGRDGTTLDLQLDYAYFKAFKQNQPEVGKQVLLDLLKEDQRMHSFYEARIKMQLGDILVSEEKFNQALIYYSQVKSLVKNTPMAQEALFKVAKTSYYKGDFDWAQTQLKVLKHATSELTANDAIALNLLIEDNYSTDSTQTALKLFARADLLSLQEKDAEALVLLNDILNDFEGEKIEDEALLRTAQIYTRMGKYEQAIAAYQKIIKDFGDGILADDAHYYLAELYRTKLLDTEKAMEHYKEIIFNHADSIFFVNSRKQYRLLRGDDIQ